MNEIIVKENEIVPFSDGLRKNYCGNPNCNEGKIKDLYAHKIIPCKICSVIREHNCKVLLEQSDSLSLNCSSNSLAKGLKGIIKEISNGKSLSQSMVVDISSGLNLRKFLLGFEALSIQKGFSYKAIDAQELFNLYKYNTVEFNEVKSCDNLVVILYDDLGVEIRDFLKAFIERRENDIYDPKYTILISYINIDHSFLRPFVSSFNFYIVR